MMSFFYICLVKSGMKHVRSANGRRPPVYYHGTHVVSVSFVPFLSFCPSFLSFLSVLPKVPKLFKDVGRARRSD